MLLKRQKIRIIFIHIEGIHISMLNGMLLGMLLDFLHLIQGQGVLFLRLIGDGLRQLVFASKSAAEWHAHRHALQHSMQNPRIEDLQGFGILAGLGALGQGAPRHLGWSRAINKSLT
jgi:hypothetical protein